MCWENIQVKYVLEWLASNAEYMHLPSFQEAWRGETLCKWKQSVRTVCSFSHQLYSTSNGCFLSGYLSRLASSNVDANLFYSSLKVKLADWIVLASIWYHLILSCCYVFECLAKQISTSPLWVLHSNKLATVPVSRVYPRRALWVSQISYYIIYAISVSTWSPLL
jgi:hypothetical protein